ncbi:MULTISPECIES: hypothetical protein [Streptosporangium]|uniref:Uncharacterized protein n=1 Tax=Streptosporangium vulgare TaxID=46190 RepID=A0ABV5TAB2_9ACTN
MAVRHIPWPVGAVLLLTHPAPHGPGGTFATAPGAEKALVAASL